jgi:hypothetical protein
LSDDEHNPNGKIRMPRELREELGELADEQWVRDLADEQYLVDGNDYEIVLSAIIPDGAEPINWDMVEAHNIDDGLYERVFSLAGDNVSAHDVIRCFVNDAKQRHATGEWVESGGTEQQTTDDNDNQTNE